MMNFVTNENLSKTMPRERITARVSHDVYATINEVEAAWFLSKFEEKFTPNTKLANALRRYNEAINDTENLPITRG